MLPDMRRVESESGNILEAGYHQEEKRLYVRFKGDSIWTFDNVSSDDWLGFEMTFSDEELSTGRYFHYVFKLQPDIYPATKMPKGE